MMHARYGIEADAHSLCGFATGRSLAYTCSDVLRLRHWSPDGIARISPTPNTSASMRCFCERAELLRMKLSHSFHRLLRLRRHHLRRAWLSGILAA
jgi:hypothetical protein